MLRVTTLIENSPDSADRLIGEHGLSFWIEDGPDHILFDTGQSGNFISNAKTLGIDLEKTDCMAVSHAHYDHAGGILPFLDAYRARPAIHLSSCFFSQGKKYHESDGNLHTDFARVSGRRYIGVAFTEELLRQRGLEICYHSDDMAQLSEHVYIFANFPRRNEFESPNPAMQLETASGFVTDPFEDEMAIGIKTPQGMVALLGCGHPGFLNMVEAIAMRTGERIYGIIGGTHLVEADASRIEKTEEKIRKMGVRLLGLSHCTGEKALERFRSLFQTFFVNCTGTQLNLETGSILPMMHSS